MSVSMKFFMREDLKSDEKIEVPGVATFCDGGGKPIPILIKALGMEEINRIRKAYTKTRIVMDDKGKRVYDKAGKPMMATEFDNIAATNRMMVESLIVPDLKDPALMEFYGCHDVMDVPMKVFKKAKDYNYVSDQVGQVNGIGDDDEMSDDELVEEAKN